MPDLLDKPPIATGRQQQPRTTRPEGGRDLLDNPPIAQPSGNGGGGFDFPFALSDIPGAEQATDIASRLFGPTRPAPEEGLQPVGVFGPTGAVGSRPEVQEASNVVAAMALGRMIPLPNPFRALARGGRSRSAAAQIARSGSPGAQQAAAQMPARRGVRGALATLGEEAGGTAVAAGTGALASQVIPEGLAPGEVPEFQESAVGATIGALGLRPATEALLRDHPKLTRYALRASEGRTRAAVAGLLTFAAMHPKETLDFAEDLAGLALGGDDEESTDRPGPRPMSAF